MQLRTHSAHLIYSWGDNNNLDDIFTRTAQIRKKTVKG